MKYVNNGLNIQVMILKGWNVWEFKLQSYRYRISLNIELYIYIFEGGTSTKESGAYKFWRNAQEIPYALNRHCLLIIPTNGASNIFLNDREY